MDPTIWGRPFWFVLHTVTLSYPDNPNKNDIDIHKNFIRSFHQIIPCGACQQHFGQYLQKYPIENFLSKKESFIEWMVNAHNQVNKAQNKPNISSSHMINLYKSIYLDPSRESLQDFFNFTNKQTNQNSTVNQVKHWTVKYTIYILSLAVLIVFLLMFSFRYFHRIK